MYPDKIIVSPKAKDGRVPDLNKVTVKKGIK